MELTLRIKETLAEITIKTGSAVIIEDLSHYNGKLKKWTVEDNMVSEFITIANELSRFNNVKDVDFVKGIIEAFLNDTERDELSEFLNLK